MAYDCRIDNLRPALNACVPTLTPSMDEWFRTDNRGSLSVGLKLHCLQHQPGLDQFLADQKKEAATRYNVFKLIHAAHCWVLPPVGNAETAIQVIRALEAATNTEIFYNPQIQIQVCSPGRLSPEAAAILTIGFLLGSDAIPDIRSQERETTFSYQLHQDASYEMELVPWWGNRLALYDCHGKLITNQFQWWYTDEVGQLRRRIGLPFEYERTDILAATSPRDIHNINLFATILVHEAHGGYWGYLGPRLREDLQLILTQHQLAHILDASWIATTGATHEDEAKYELVLQELVSYAIAEAENLPAHDDNAFPSILFAIDRIISIYRQRMEDRVKKLSIGK